MIALHNRILVAVSLLLIGSTSCWAQRGPAVVEITRAKSRSELVPKQQVVGTIAATRTAVIGSAVDGRVVEMKVREGDRVEKGQELALLLTETIQLEIDAAAAELELRRKELEELENGSRPDEIQQSAALVEAAKVNAEYLENERQRQEALRANNSISASDYDQTVALALEAKQRLLEATAAYQLIVDGPRPERIAQAKAKVSMQEANLGRLQDQKAKYTIRSRFAGYVTVEHTEEGQWVSRGEPVAEVVALDQVDAVVQVLEAHIPFVRVGDEVSVQVPALNKTIPGVVAAIIPKADVRSRTFPVKIQLDNILDADEQPTLKAGMLARAELAVGQSPNALIVPKDAIVFGGPKPIVWVIQPDSISPGEGNMQTANAIPVPVTTGAEDDDWIEVSIVSSSRSNAPNAAETKSVGSLLTAESSVIIRGNERIPMSRPGGPPSQVTWAASNGK